MALIICPECGKEYSNKALSCPHCGCPTEIDADTTEESKIADVGDADNCVISVKEIVEEAQEGLGDEDSAERPRGKKLKIIIPICAVIILLVAFAIYLFASPKTVPWCCIHKTNEATCTEAKVCSRCGKIFEEALGHEWVDATCTEPQTCSVCHEIYGVALGHRWEEATCTEPKTCSVCHMMEGEPTGHDWKAATCVSPKTCRICGTTEGEPAGHKWKAATCTDKKKCTVCGKQEGQPLGHNVKDYKCTRCNATVVTEQDIPNIIELSNLRYKVNSVGGVSLTFTITNKSKDKTIKYIRILFNFYNSFADKLTNEVGGKTEAGGTLEGPIKPGKSQKIDTKVIFYNSRVKGYLPLYVWIEYTDGTTLVINDPDSAKNFLLMYAMVKQ